MTKSSTPRSNARHQRCELCGGSFPLRAVTPLRMVRPTLLAAMVEAHPGIDQAGYVCHPDLDRFRIEHVRRVLADQIGEVSRLEESVVERIASHDMVTRDVDEDLDEQRSLGERVADRVAAFGGSWTFLGLFGLLMAVWMAANVALRGAAFDPYPFILLNLALSCLAAVQAPVIMMSQNRQELRDRRHARNDYLVNLKAELEIRLLHEKLDHLLRQQWEHLGEIQEIQIEMLHEIDPRRRGG